MSRTDWKCGHAARPLEMSAAAEAPQPPVGLTLAHVQAVALDNLVKTEAVAARVGQLSAALRNLIRGECELSAGPPKDRDAPRVAHPLQAAVAIQGKGLDDLAEHLETLLAMVG